MQAEAISTRVTAQSTASVDSTHMPVRATSAMSYQNGPYIPSVAVAVECPASPAWPLSHRHSFIRLFQAYARGAYTIGELRLKQQSLRDQRSTLEQSRSLLGREVDEDADEPSPRSNSRTPWKLSGIWQK